MDIHGWSFQPSTQISNTWTTGFTLSYTIAVDLTINPALRMFTSTDQMNAGLIPSGITISDTQTGVTPSPLVLTGVTTDAETIQSNPYSLTSLTTTSIVDFHGGNWTLASYEQDWYETAIPEPMSFVLIGTGLLGLGLLRRRVRG